MAKSKRTLVAATQNRLKANLRNQQTADLDEQKPEWTDIVARSLKKFVNTSRLTLVMAMSDYVEDDEVLNLGDDDDSFNAVQFAMWRIPSKTPFHLLSGNSAGGSATNLVILNKMLRDNKLDMVIESVSGQMYISVSTDYRLFAPSAML